MSHFGGVLNRSAFLPIIHRNPPEIKRQFASFDATGKLPPALDNILIALKSFPPTSVEAERAFSAAGLFSTKLHSQLDDKTIDILCFLRHYFLRK